MKSRNLHNFCLAIFLMIVAGILIFASVALYPAIVEVSANLTKMLFHALGHRT